MTTQPHTVEVTFTPADGTRTNTLQLETHSPPPQAKDELLDMVPLDATIWGIYKGNSTKARD